MPVPEYDPYSDSKYNYPTLHKNLRLEDGQFEVEAEPAVTDEDQAAFEVSETFSAAEDLGRVATISQIQADHWHR